MRPSPCSRLWCFLLLASLSFAAQAQPSITSFSPQVNTTAAPVASPVRITFSQPLATTSAAGLQVHSHQRGGRRNPGGASTAVSGNTLTYQPSAAQPWLPGETVFSTISTAVSSSSGAVARGRVFQFTAAVGGTGRGNFTAPLQNAEVAVSGRPEKVSLADVDSDGDLDLLLIHQQNGTLNIQLNNGTGIFTAQAAYAGAPDYHQLDHIVLGDLDGDGDLDLIAAAEVNVITTVQVNRNDGTGRFTGAAIVPMDDVFIRSLALGDVDGDGDLDLLAAHSYGPNGTVSIRLNNGRAEFTAPVTAAELAVSGLPASMALGDIDRDGDLDLLSADSNGGTVSVRVNDGSGRFLPPTAASEVAVGLHPVSVALGDIDGDADLDMVAANIDSGTASVRFNDGYGNFTVPPVYVPAPINPSPAIGTYPEQIVLGDVDADGDLDLLAANRNGRSVSVRLNDGRGHFAPSPVNADPPLNRSPYGLALGDLDGDGDLDVAAANGSSSVISVLFNDPTVPLASIGTAKQQAEMSLFPNPLHGTHVNVAGLPAGAVVTVYDALARPITGARANARGVAEVVLPAGLAGGVYVVRSEWQARILVVN